MTSTIVRPDYSTDSRFRSGILTPAEVATLARASRPTVYSWMRDTGTRNRVIHSVPNRRGWPTIPLVGLVEAHTLRVLRKAGVPLGQLSEAAERAREDNDDPYVLASEEFVTDGIDVFRRQHDDLFRFGDAQMPIRQVVEPFIRPLTFARDGYAESFLIPLRDDVELRIVPGLNAGRPTLTRTGVPAFVVTDELAAGSTPNQVAESYGIDLVEVLAVDNADVETKGVF